MIFLNILLYLPNVCVRCLCCEWDNMIQVESFVLDQAELDDEPRLENSTFLLSATEEAERNVDPETQARLEALLEAAGKFFFYNQSLSLIQKFSISGTQKIKTFSD